MSQRGAWWFSGRMFDLSLKDLWLRSRDSLVALHFAHKQDALPSAWQMFNQGRKAIDRTLLDMTEQWLTWT